MYLSKLEILGFKSFANKTAFDFKDGMTGVVGPNGCGKSNIVDAIRWVLGEQKAGVLRSERMENVIFNGSRTQRPLGMAEVSLTIENTKNVLPIEYSEVVITRRLFRSGESQYLLNNTICRLKDIMNLFMDTGMGANAYSVIELSMVEQILNGKAEERRHIFEEAAGVGKYKSRRKAAFRKLEATENDLTRLNDVLSEVEKNVASLKRQVQKAKRYQAYSDELKDIELKFTNYQFNEIKNDLEPLTVQSKEFSDRREELSAQVDTEEAEIEELRLEVLELEKQLVSQQRELNENTERIQKKEEDVLVSQERARAVQENRTRYKQEIDELNKRREMLAEMRVTLNNQLGEIQDKLQELEVDFAEHQRALESHREAYESKRKELRGIETQRSADAESVSTLHKEEERLRTQLEYGEQRIQKLQQEQQDLQRQNTELVAAREHLSQEVAKSLTRLDQLNLESESIQEQAANKQASIDEIKKRISDRTHEMQRNKDRVALLRKFLESLEDHPEGVRHLLLDGGMPEGCFGIFGDQINVPEQYRYAVEAALGDAVAALLVDHSDRAFEGIGRLRQAEKGAVTFFSVNGKDSNQSVSVNGGTLSSDPRVANKIAEVIECKQEFRPLVNILLADCYLVNNLDDARALAELKTDSKASFITPAGDVVSNWGLIRGGQSENDGNTIVGRRQQIDELENEIERLEIEIDDSVSSQERAETELKDLLTKNDHLTGQRKSYESDRQKLEIEFGQAAFRVTKTEEELGQHEQEIKHNQELLNQHKTRLAEIEPKLQEIESQRKVAEESYTALASQIEVAEQTWRQAEQDTNAANLKVVEARAEVRNVESEIERSEKSRQEIGESIEIRAEQIDEAESQEKELTEHVNEVREQLQGDFAVRKELEELVQGMERTFREHKTQADQKEKELKPKRTEREDVSERLHQAELRISELKMKRENLVNHIQETYEMDLVKYVAETPIDSDEEFDSAAVDERVHWLRNRLKGMGPVNMLALTDYEKENERFEFLTSQKEDLIKAEENLKETIKVINDSAYERFGKVFSLIRENFIQVFKSFFEGGIADLKISDGDPLEADIIIEANPKGRKLGSLALLSGGEKTLTAISLLFAIYLVKPSPFCILDEVDAPLDDNNIGRFTGALKKFSENTQFICVTHNKGTMQATDYLYGVTMEEQGVSKVVSVKFGDGEMQRFADNQPKSAQELN